MKSNYPDPPDYAAYPVTIVEPQEIISVQKFILLTILTFGLYGLWWMYKSWRFFKQKNGLDVMPAMRALFAIFFVSGLFERILNYAKEKGWDGDYSSAAFAAGFILLQLSSRLRDPYGYFSIFAFAFLITPFNVLNYAKRHDPDLTVIELESFNGRQIVLLAIGGLLWLLVIAGFIIELLGDRYDI